MSLICILPGSIFLICILLRYREYKELLLHGLDNTKSGSDICTQFFYFIKSLTQPSLCPYEFTNKFKGAGLYYPLGIYWISINIALRISKTNRKLITLEDLKDKEHYGSLALKICLAINLLIMPVLIGICLVFMPYLLIGNSLYATLLAIFLVTFMNLYLPSKNYPIQTRTIGFFCASVFALFLIVCFQSNYNPLDIGFLYNTNAYQIKDVTGLFGHAVASVFSIMTLSSIIFVCFRSSQQGSMFLMSLLIASFIISNDVLAQSIGISLFIALNIPLYQPSLDSFNFFRSHILNRLHDNTWYLKTYGVQKYNLISFAKQDCITSIKSLLSFDIDPRSGDHHVRYKRSWMSQLIENRILLYSLIFVVIGFIQQDGIRISGDTSFDLLILMSFATILPCFLCCLRVLQGYGPPLHYIEFFTPFNWFTLLIYLNNHQIENIFVIWILIDLVITTLVLCKKNIQHSRPSENLNSDKSALSLIDKFIPDNERTILEYVNYSIINNSFQNRKFAVIRGHYQMVLECAVIISSNLFSGKIKDEIRETHAFPIVDNQTYSFYNHWKWIFTKISSLIDSHVTEIFVDPSDPNQRNYLLSLKSHPYFKDWKIIKANLGEMIIYKSSKT